VAPALATTTSPIASHSSPPSVWPSTTTPASAAPPGSSDIRTPNTRAGSRRDREPGPELQRADGGDDEHDAARLVAHLRPVTTVRSYSGSLRICRSVNRIGSHRSCEYSRV
jgi:hypothetical protein